MERLEVGMCQIGTLLNIGSKATNRFMHLQTLNTYGLCAFTGKSTGDQKLHCELNVPSEINQAPKQP